MKEQNKKLTIAERLRNGEKVICAECKKAIMLLMRKI